MNIRQMAINYVRPIEIQTEIERTSFLFLFILTFTQIVAFQAWQMLYSNFVLEEIGLNGGQGSVIQAVREIPGLLAISVIFLLKYIKEESLAVLSVFILGIGVAITGLFPSFLGMIFTTLCMSIGFHYYETINQSITLQAFDQKLSPLVIGRLRSISALGNIIVALLIISFAVFFTYFQLYLFAGLLTILGAIWANFKKPNLSILTAQRKKLIFKKKYWLFYALSFLSGGRRQILIIFSLFLLVEKFEYSVIMITVLFLINNTINWLLNPLIGRMINRFGEQKLLTMQFLPAIFIFLGYAFIDNGLIVALLYIIDQFTFNFNIAERTFFQKIGEPQDFAHTTALSFTIKHLTAVFIPLIGGFLWMINYQFPFILGAILAALSLWLTQFINKEIEKNKT